MSRPTNGNFVESVKQAVISDMIKMQGKEKGYQYFRHSIYKLIIPNNPKCEPISGLHHFLGTAFIATRIVQYLGLDEYKQAVAFLGGILHDFEKMGPYLTVQQVKGLEINRDEAINLVADKVEGYLDATELGLTIESFLNNKYKKAIQDAVNLAMGLEGGGASRTLYLVKEAIRIGDYLTGSRESADVFNAERTIKKYLKKVETISIAVGSSRPLVSTASEKLIETLIENNLIPLVSTGTGILVLGSRDKIMDIRTKILKDITKSITSTGKEALKLYKGEKIEEKKTKSNNFERVVGQISAIIAPEEGKAPTIKANSIGYVSPAQIEEYLKQNSGKTAEYKKAIIASILIIIKQVYRETINTKEILKVAEELGINTSKLKQKTKQSKEDLIRSLYNTLPNQGSIKPLRKILDKAMRTLARASEDEARAALDEKYIYSVVEESFSIPNRTNRPITKFNPKRTGSKDRMVCNICRREVPHSIRDSSLLKAFTVKTFLDRHKDKFGKISTSDLWHPDIQGMPTSASGINLLTKELYICPVCFYEYVLYPYISGSVEGNWHIVLHYSPSMSVDLLDVIKSVIRDTPEYAGRVKWIVADYMASRIIIEPHIASPNLTTGILRAGLHYWYWYGGSVLLTTTPYTSPITNNPRPFQLENTDVVIDAAVEAFIESLKRTCETKTFTQMKTYKIRDILYNQLHLYIRALERVTKNKLILTKSGLAPVRHPALEIVSFYLNSLER